MSESSINEAASSRISSDLERIGWVSSGLTEAFSMPPKVERQFFTGDELDVLMPVEEGLKPASLHWADLDKFYYQVGDGTSSDQQLVYTFARCAAAVSPNRLGHAGTIAKTGRYMRAMQSGVQQRFVNEGYSVPRDESEAYIAQLLAEARDFVSGSPLDAYDQARKDCGLLYTPGRRVRRVAQGVKSALHLTTT